MSLPSRRELICEEIRHFLCGALCRTIGCGSVFARWFEWPHRLICSSEFCRWLDR